MVHGEQQAQHEARCGGRVSANGATVDEGVVEEFAFACIVSARTHGHIKSTCAISSAVVNERAGSQTECTCVDLDGAALASVVILEGAAFDEDLTALYIQSAGVKESIPFAPRKSQADEPDI